MSYLKRILWLAAWSVWLWLGFGLYWELPRDLGPVVSRFPMRENEGDHTFLFGAHEIVTQESQGDDKPIIVRVWNVDTGELVRKIDQGPVQQKDRGELWLSGRNAIMIAAKRPLIEGRPQPTGSSALDLRTGFWVDLPLDAIGEPVFHDERPVAAFSELGGENGNRGRVVVVDLRTGAALFRWDGAKRDGPPRELSDEAFFIGDSLVGVPTQKVLGPNEDYDTAAAALEVWTISPAEAPMKVFPGIRACNRPTSSATDRIAWHEFNQEGWVDVLDVHEGRIVFSDPPNRKPSTGGFSGAWPSPFISRDGRRVLGRVAKKIWDVDSGREIWAGAKRSDGWLYETDQHVKSVDRDRFEVEEWRFLKLGRRRFGETVYAVRSLATGELLYRCWESSLPPHADVTSDRAIYFDRENEVIRSLSPRPSCALLALCQTILALPLVLLWAVLRWRAARRKRAEASLHSVQS